MKAIKLIISIIEEIVFSGSQSREYKLIAKINKGENTYKVQVHIKRDSHASQSYAVIDVWKENALEWGRVASIPYGEMKTITTYARINDKSGFKVDKDKLMELAEHILF